MKLLRISSENTEKRSLEFLLKIILYDKKNLQI